MMYLSCGADMDSLPLCVCVWAGKEGGGHRVTVRELEKKDRERERGREGAGWLEGSYTQPPLPLPPSTFFLPTHPASVTPVRGLWQTARGFMCVYVYAAAVWRVDVKGQAHGLGHLPPRSQTQTSCLAPAFSTCPPSHSAPNKHTRSTNEQICNCCNDEKCNVSYIVTNEADEAEAWTQHTAKHAHTL